MLALGQQHLGEGDQAGAEGGLQVVPGVCRLLRLVGAFGGLRLGGLGAGTGEGRARARGRGVGGSRESAECGDTATVVRGCVQGGGRWRWVGGVEGWGGVD